MYYVLGISADNTRIVKGTKFLNTPNDSNVRMINHYNQELKTIELI